MKAVVQSEYGPASVLQIREVPKPTVGPHDVLVRVKAVATNPIDFKKRVNFGMPSTSATGEKLPLTAGWDIPPTLSAVGKRVFHQTVDHLIIGWDASGVVEEVGKDVKHYKAGQEVFFCGDFSRQGCNSELVAVDERLVGKKPSNISHLDAAAFPLTGLTAWESLTDLLGIHAPQQAPTGPQPTILIYNGAGGVGSIAIQIASRVLKLNVVATASRPESIEFCKKMGAHHVINHRNNLVEELAKIGIPEVDYIFNTFDLTAKLFDDFVAVSRPFGRIASVAVAFEPLNLIPAFVKSISFSYELVFTRGLYREGPQMDKQRVALNHISDLVEKGVLVSHATVKFDAMKDIQEAHKLQEGGQVIGKIVLNANF